MFVQWNLRLLYDYCISIRGFVDSLFSMIDNFSTIIEGQIAL